MVCGTSMAGSLTRTTCGQDNSFYWLTLRPKFGTPSLIGRLSKTFITSRGSSRTLHCLSDGGGGEREQERRDESPL